MCVITGVIKQGSGYTTYGSHKADAIVAVNLTSNKSAVGVGRLTKSSADLYLSRNSGVAVKMQHVFGDKLWGLEPSQTLQIPNAGATVKVPTLGVEEFPALGASSNSSRKKNDAPQSAPANASNQQSPSTENADGDPQLEASLANMEISTPDENTEQDEPVESPDDKLKRAFLVSIKKMGKKPPTPLLTSNFYRCHILEAGSDIDIKHTSYKKLSKFLQEMAANDYLTIKEETKGVEKIVAFNIKHPDVVNTILTASRGDGGDQSGPNSDNLFVTEMKELYFVTQDTIKFFNIFDVKLGEGLEPAQVKKYLKDYVCNNKLQGLDNIKTINLDPVLRELCGLDESIATTKFDEILADVTDRMEHSYAMRNRNELKTSGKSVPIKMSIAKRSGNKTVTLIDHLEMFGIRLPEFAQACKHGVAASTSIYRPDCPGNSNKGQLLVQGNQVAFVYKLLTETYKIPPKYISGNELAKKEKKPKKKK